MGDGPESGGIGMTVLLPTFNRAEVLRLTLDALTHVDQSGIDWDLVVIDNDCTDHTRDVVAEYRVPAPPDVPPGAPTRKELRSQPSAARMSDEGDRGLHG